MKMIIFSIVAIFLFKSCTTDKFDQLIEQDLDSNTNKSKSMDEIPLLDYYLKKMNHLQKRDYTRRVVKYEILDLETGNKTISYSCLQPGQSCDVGQKKEEDKGKLLLVPRNSWYESDAIEQFLYANCEMETEFPLLYSAQVKNDLLDDLLKIEFNGSDLTLIQSATNIPLFNYKINGETNVPTTISETRKAMVDPATGKFTCTQPGSNCVIRSESTSNFENEVLETFIQSFPNIDIQNAVRDNRYAICKNGLDFELRIFNSDHVVSSHLYLSSQL
ncbi:MAG: hypothetical protein JNK69_00210 [Saprospiraceae bacterium]|nr:hypothetical protein [Saprospiraceae bacterium]HRG34163.1 hypothetical protein [Saprospiraceae bacterium]